MAGEVFNRGRRFVRLGLVAGAIVCASTAMAFAEPGRSSTEPAAKDERHAAVVPGPGSISLVVLAGGCLLYGRKRRAVDAPAK